MHTLNTTTTTNGFTVTQTSAQTTRRGMTGYRDFRWTCTCGRSESRNAGWVVAHEGSDASFAAHVAMHDTEGNTLVVTGSRHESFFTDLVTALGDAVVEWTFTPGTFTSRGRTIVRNELVVVIDPSVTTPADAHATARGRGFTANFRIAA